MNRRAPQSPRSAKGPGISTRTLDTWRKEGKIEAVEIEHRVFIPEAEVERMVAQQA